MPAHLEEDKARQIFKQIRAGWSYRDGHSTVNRDLKTDNIFLAKNGKVKNMDFVLSAQVEPEQILNQNCGASLFGSPDLSLGKFYNGPKKDIWTLKQVQILLY